MRRWAWIRLFCVIAGLHQIEVPALQKTLWCNYGIGGWRICCERKDITTWSRDIAEKEPKCTKMNLPECTIRDAALNHKRYVPAQCGLRIPSSVKGNLIRESVRNEKIMVWNGRIDYRPDSRFEGNLATRIVFTQVSLPGNGEGYIRNFFKPEFPSDIRRRFPTRIYNTKLDRDGIPILQWFQQYQVGGVNPRSIGGDGSFTSLRKLPLKGAGCVGGFVPCAVGKYDQKQSEGRDNPMRRVSMVQSNSASRPPDIGPNLTSQPNGVLDKHFRPADWYWFLFLIAPLPWMAGIDLIREAHGAWPDQFDMSRWCIGFFNTIAGVIIGLLPFVLPR